MMLWSQYTLGAVFSETAQVVAMAVTLSLLIGVPLAFVSVFFRFPGRRFLSHAVILPLIFPTYVLAFVWIGWMDYSGPVQTWLRDIGLMIPLSFRSKWGLGWVMGLA
jgi:iron(III) transport system permease protein